MSSFQAQIRQLRKNTRNRLSDASKRISTEIADEALLMHARAVSVSSKAARISTQAFKRISYIGDIPPPPPPADHNSIGRHNNGPMESSNPLFTAEPTTTQATEQAQVSSGTGSRRKTSKIRNQRVQSKDSPQPKVEPPRSSAINSAKPSGSDLNWLLAKARNMSLRVSHRDIPKEYEDYKGKMFTAPIPPLYGNERKAERPELYAPVPPGFDDDPKPSTAARASKKPLGNTIKSATFKISHLNAQFEQYRLREFHAMVKAAAALGKPQPAVSAIAGPRVLEAKRMEGSRSEEYKATVASYHQKLSDDKPSLSLETTTAQLTGVKASIAKWNNAIQASSDTKSPTSSSKTPSPTHASSSNSKLPTSPIHANGVPTQKPWDDKKSVSGRGLSGTELNMGATSDKRNTTNLKVPSSTSVHATAEMPPPVAVKVEPRLNQVVLNDRFEIIRLREFQRLPAERAARVRQKFTLNPDFETIRQREFERIQSEGILVKKATSKANLSHSLARESIKQSSSSRDSISVQAKEPHGTSRTSVQKKEAPVSTRASNGNVLNPSTGARRSSLQTPENVEAAAEQSPSQPITVSSKLGERASYALNSRALRRGSGAPREKPTGGGMEDMNIQQSYAPTQAYGNAQHKTQQPMQLWSSNAPQELQTNMTDEAMQPLVSPMSKRESTQQQWSGPASSGSLSRQAQPSNGSLSRQQQQQWSSMSPHTSMNRQQQQGTIDQQQQQQYNMQQQQQYTAQQQQQYAQQQQQQYAAQQQQQYAAQQQQQYAAQQQQQYAAQQQQQYAAQQQQHNMQQQQYVAQQQQQYAMQQQYAAQQQQQQQMDSQQQSYGWGMQQQALGNLWSDNNNNQQNQSSYEGMIEFSGSSGSGQTSPRSRHRHVPSDYVYDAIPHDMIPPPPQHTGSEVKPAKRGSLVSMAFRAISGTFGGGSAPQEPSVPPRNYSMNVPPPPPEYPYQDRDPSQSSMDAPELPYREYTHLSTVYESRHEYLDSTSSAAAALWDKTHRHINPATL